MKDELGGKIMKKTVAPTPNIFKDMFYEYSKRLVQNKDPQCHKSSQYYF